MAIFCKKCGMPIPDDADFCINCGSRRELVQPVTQQVNLQDISNGSANQNQNYQQYNAQPVQTPPANQQDPALYASQYEKMFDEPQEPVDDNRKRKKTIILLCSIGAAVVALVVALILIFGSSPKKAAKIYMDVFTSFNPNKISQTAPKQFWEWAESERDTSLDDVKDAIKKAKDAAADMDAPKPKYSIKGVDNVNSQDTKDIADALNKRYDIDINKIKKAKTVTVEVKLDDNKSEMELTVVKIGMRWYVVMPAGKEYIFAAEGFVSGGGSGGSGAADDLLGGLEDGVEIDCPDFTGLTRQEVESHALATMFVITFEEKTSDDHDIGKVYEQFVEAGEKVSMGTEITLVINVKEVEVPDLSEETEEDAKKQLEKLGLTVVIEKIADDEIEEGLVIKTDPEDGETLYTGDEIKLFVSLGAESKDVGIPYVVEKNYVEAIRIIEEAGLVANIVERDLAADEEYLDAGFVIAQDPAANANQTVPQGSIITIYVSTGLKNYTFAPEVPVHPELKNYTGSATFSLWLNGEFVDKIGPYRLSELKSLGFSEFTSSRTNETFSVYITFDTEKDFKYGDVTVNTQKNISTISYDTSDYGSDDFLDYINSQIADTPAE